MLVGPACHNIPQERCVEPLRACADRPPRPYWSYLRQQNEHRPAAPTRAPDTVTLSVGTPAMASRLPGTPRIADVTPVRPMPTPGTTTLDIVRRHVGTGRLIDVLA